MELYAAGLNAWGQLDFDQVKTDQEPDDISHFTCVLRDDNISAVYPRFSYTLVHVQSGPLVAGLVPPDHKPLTVLAPPTFSHFAQAANGITVASDNHASRHTPTPGKPWLRTSELFPSSVDIAQLVAYDAGFAALSTSGQVWTWGDERYASCLGRDGADARDCNTPSLVTGLLDLPTGPITKIAAGGYVVAALTSGNDLYVWGHAGRAVAAGLSGLEIADDPTPVVLEDRDIADIAVGEAHLVALATTGEVFVIGSNSNGQLGQPGTKSAETWTKLDLGEKHVVAVAAGPRNSFSVVRSKHPNI